MPTPVADIIATLLGAPVAKNDPRLARLHAMEKEFDVVCKMNSLDVYADDVADYLVDAEGKCRQDLDSRAFALRFAVSDAHATVVVEYVQAFFDFFK